MVKATELRREHDLIERELIELETIIQSTFINYPNLIHVLKRLREIWDKHEQKEEVYFLNLYNKGFTIPIRKITFEHGKLKRDTEVLLKGLQSGSEHEMHNALFKFGQRLINNLRQHMKDEDWILYALPEHL